jgi:hypothetical protein
VSTFLNLVESVFHLIGSSVGRLVAAAGLAILFVFAFWFQVFRLDLWATPGMWIGAAFCWLGLWLAGVLYDTGKPAKFVGILCSVCLVGITIARLLPNTAEGGRKVVTYQDKKNLERADKSVVEVIRPFECNSANMDTISYFGRDGVTGDKVALIHYARDSKGRVLCFREQGVYDKTGDQVVPVSSAIIDEIAHQPPPEVPKLVAMAPVPTTLPDLSEGPIPQSEPVEAAH